MTYDVVVLGEVLLEVTTELPLGHDVPARLGISGDALNVAAAAAATGARVGVATVLTADALGSAIEERIAELGISTDLVRRHAGQQGVYFSHIDPDGSREFVYVRGGSVGSTLAPSDLDDAVLSEAGAVVASGITAALSPTANAAVHHAARTASTFVYDPNHRPRLRSAESARDDLLALAPHCRLVTPSYPAETSMLGYQGPAAPQWTAEHLITLGARAVAVTQGSDGVHLVEGDTTEWVPSVPAPIVIDQTGAGDAFVGATTARLVAGDDLASAVRYAVAVSSLVVSARGGTGLVPTPEQVHEHLAAATR